MAELIKDLGAGRIYIETGEQQGLQTCEPIEPAACAALWAFTPAETPGAQRQAI